MLGPAGLPRKLLAKIHEDTVKAIRSPQVVERFAAQGLEVQATAPDEFAAFVKAELAKWGNVVRTAGLKVQ